MSCLQSHIEDMVFSVETRHGYVRSVFKFPFHICVLSYQSNVPLSVSNIFPFLFCSPFSTFLHLVRFLSFIPLSRRRTRYLEQLHTEIFSTFKDVKSLFQRLDRLTSMASPFQRPHLFFYLDAMSWEKREKGRYTPPDKAQSP